MATENTSVKKAAVKTLKVTSVAVVLASAAFVALEFRSQRIGLKLYAAHLEKAFKSLADANEAEIKAVVEIAKALTK